MKLEDIHTFINTEPLVNVLAECADAAREETNESGDPEGDETGSRSDADETSNGTGAGSNNGEVTLSTDVVDKDPAQDTEGSGGIGVEEDEHGAGRSVQGRATVEAEPSEPDQNCAQEDERGVVRLVVDLVALVDAFSEHEGICESTPSGGDVDRTSTGEIEGREVEQPAIGIPCPARDRAIDDRGPAESKDHGWEDATAFERA